MATAKTTTLFRIEPGLKVGLRAAADREHLSIVNMIGVLIRDYCGRNGIAIQEQQPQSLGSAPKSKSRKP